MPGSSKITEVQAIAAIDDALGGLEDAAMRTRVLVWALAKYGEPGQTAVARRQAEVDGGSAVPHGPSALSSTGQMWLRRNSIDETSLGEVFSLDQDVVDIVAGEIPGDSTRARMRNVFLLRGACAYLVSGEARFTDDAVRSTCRHYDAYDQSNFSNSIRSMSDEISGSKDTGYGLTPRGLKSAAALLKQMAGG